MLQIVNKINYIFDRDIACGSICPGSYGPGLACVSNASFANSFVQDRYIYGHWDTISTSGLRHHMFEFTRYLHEWT